MPLINQERMKNLLIELIKIDSLSRQERDVAMRLKRDLEELGATVSIDDAGEKVGGNVGNLIAQFPGNAPAARRCCFPRIWIPLCPVRALYPSSTATSCAATAPPCSAATTKAAWRLFVKRCG